MQHPKQTTPTPLALKDIHDILVSSPVSEAAYFTSQFSSAFSSNLINTHPYPSHKAAATKLIHFFVLFSAVFGSPKQYCSMALDLIHRRTAN